MTNEEILNELIKEGDLVNLYILARWMYRMGDDLMDDKTYDKIERTIKECNLTPLVNQSYDDDDCPVELLKRFGKDNLIVNGGTTSEYAKYLEDDKSISIRAVSNVREAYEYSKDVIGEDLIFSPKADGINLKGGYIKLDKDSEYNELCLALTRGRKGNSFDVTTRYRQINPLKLKAKNEVVTVFGEGIVDESAMETIRQPNGDKFTAPKNAANSMMRVFKYSKEDLSHLKLYAFNADGLADTISETIDKLKEAGFTTVPYKVVKAEDVPKDFETFKPWIEEIMNEMYELAKSMDLHTDGVVMDVNNKNYVGSFNGHHSTKNIALKFGRWASKYYTGKIVGFDIEQQAVNASTVILIEPLTTEDNAVSRRVTGYNLDQLITNGLYPGQLVYFERNSEAIAVSIRGQRLKELKEGKLDLVEGMSKSNSFK